MKIQLIKNELQYDVALDEIKRLCGAATDSAERYELDNWLVAVAQYEDAHRVEGI